MKTSEVGELLSHTQATRPVTNLGHQRGEEFSERGPKILCKVQ